MSIKERLVEFIGHLGIPVSQFEKKIQVSNGYVNSMRKGLGVEKLEQLRAIYPELNINWLITGEGDMLKNSSAKYSNKNTQVTLLSKEFRGVPYYEDIEATGGVLALNNDFKEIPTFYINYEHFNDCTAYLQIVGDSMFPKYCSGEILAIKRVFNFDIVLWGEAYLICTNEDANNLRTVKLLFQHPDQAKIILRASNPNFAGDTVINKADIVSLFIVKGKITRNQL